MRNTFFLLLFLISGACFSQNPDPFWDGIRTKLVQPDTLSTFDRDALTPKLGTILYHKDTGISQWEQWNGTAWVEFGAGAEYTFSDTPEIDLTLTGDDVTADIVAGSIDETKLDASVNTSLDLADSSIQPSSPVTLGGGSLPVFILDSDRIESFTVPGQRMRLFGWDSLRIGSNDKLIIQTPDYDSASTGDQLILQADGGLEYGSALSSITGAASTIVTSDLTNNRALISNGSGKVAVSAVTSTELSYVGGVTSALQTQLNAKLNSSTYTSDWSGLNSGNFLRSDQLDNVTGTGIVFNDGSYLQIGTNNSIRLSRSGAMSTPVIDIYEGDLYIRDGINSFATRFTFGRTTGNFTATGTGDFGGTVSGDDPVNADDFVTKGYAESNFGSPMTVIDRVLVQSTVTTVGTDVTLYDFNNAALQLASDGDFFEFKFMFTYSGSTSNTLHPIFQYGSSSTGFSTNSNVVSGSFSVEGYGMRKTDNSVSVYFTTRLAPSGFEYNTVIDNATTQSRLRIGYTASAATSITLKTGYIKKYTF